MNEIQTIPELKANTKFIELVEKNISEAKHKRHTRPAPAPGYKYRRDAFDAMNDQGLLTSDYFLQHIESIWNKQSSLSSQVRDIILVVCSRAYRQTVEFYNNQKKEENGNNTGSESNN